MPRISRKTKRRKRPTSYGPEHIRHLERGFGFIGPAFETEKSMCQAWVELRGEILKRWTAEHPGRRPWAWWRFEAPGRRERVDGGEHPHDRDNFPERLKKLSFGKPSCHLISDDLAAEYESEFDFLKRHNLLTPEEIAKCEA